MNMRLRSVLCLSTSGPKVTALLALALLAACGGEADKPEKPEQRDPAVTGALRDQIMVDPDLAGQNEVDAGLSGQNAAEVTIPPELRTPEAIAAAKAEAEKLAGGTVDHAPAAAAGGAGKLAVQAATAAQTGAKSAGDCAAKVDYAMSWAAALPQPLGVYPRGAVQEAAGIDKDGCRLRVVTFHTPVTTGDVIDFYYTRLRRAGYGAARTAEGTDDVLGGRRGAESYVIYARKLDNGLTEVDLVSGG